MQRQTARFIVRSALAAALAVSLSACAFYDDDAPVSRVDPPVEEIFAQAEALYEAGSYGSATKQYDEVERLYPTSSYAKRAILKSAQSSHAEGDFGKAAISAGRFLDFYPSDERAPFAQYLIAISHYDQIVDVGRDQARTKQALQSLRELIARYPSSPYAAEAKLKLDLTLDHLAGKEMEIGRYYLKRGQYIGAINRFRAVVEDYQTTSHVAEALHRLVEAYLALGVTKEAQTAAAVLGHNFPGSDWYLDSYALLTGRDLRPERDDESWIVKAYDRVVRGKWL